MTLQAHQLKQEAKRRRSETGQAGGQLPKRAKGAKLQWWEADDGAKGAAGSAARGTAQGAAADDDDVQEYIREVRAARHIQLVG